jgi:hypothetical protein
MEQITIKASAKTICLTAYSLMCLEGGDGMVTVVCPDYDKLSDEFRSLLPTLKFADRLDEFRLDKKVMFTDESNESLVFGHPLAYADITKWSLDDQESNCIDDYIIIADIV